METWELPHPLSLTHTARFVEAAALARLWGNRLGLPLCVPQPMIIAMLTGTAAVFGMIPPCASNQGCWAHRSPMQPMHS